MEQFCALRFTQDANLTDRVYWYRSPFPVKEGERVLAPVGPHDRLQCARVERAAAFSEENAPYPVSLCKEVVSRYGEREVFAGCYELGGVRYDGRHYTRFNRIWVASEEADLSALPLGVGQIEAGEDCLLRVSAANGTVVITGKDARAAAALILRIVRGEEKTVPPSVLSALREKLC